jgi:hypothetical protein
VHTGRDALAYLRILIVEDEFLVAMLVEEMYSRRTRAWEISPLRVIVCQPYARASDAAPTAPAVS